MNIHIHGGMLISRKDVGFFASFYANYKQVLWLYLLESLPEAEPTTTMFHMKAILKTSVWSFSILICSAQGCSKPGGNPRMHCIFRDTYIYGAILYGFGLQLSWGNPPKTKISTEKEWDLNPWPWWRNGCPPSCSDMYVWRPNLLVLQLPNCGVYHGPPHQQLLLHQLAENMLKGGATFLLSAPSGCSKCSGGSRRAVWVA